MIARNYQEWPRGSKIDFIFGMTLGPVNIGSYFILPGQHWFWLLFGILVTGFYLHSGYVQDNLADLRIANREKQNDQTKGGS